ncbi:MAG: glutamine-hydrolyzing carbamoyl-phosphate synthase small subunit [Desulfitobacteriaceae bacterium]|nr:glutamine-hydrolyzing carbamoyl-phosphate synthase small subunit [Desulfitobacteriaceae bacterium]
MKGFLALEDGTIFEGKAFGALGSSSGEVVFNTSMTGYQEILTDPSYCGQIITMTYPLIGNYGINKEDMESSVPKVRGLIVRELCDIPSNWRATGNLESFLKEHNIIGIQGLDTRALTRKLRSQGTMGGILTTEDMRKEEMVEMAKKAPGLLGQDLVSQVTTKVPYTIEGNEYRVVVMDFGVKQNIIKWLSSMGCTVTVVPAQTKAEEIAAFKPDGLMLSNGPGDPKGVMYAVETIKKMLGRLPIFGICMGHLLLGLALGGDTYKLPYGHRGGNQPVKDLATGRIYITSQNHGFTIDPDSLNSDSVEVSHLNLNDNTVEGIKCKRIPAFSVQYYPEAFPGSADSKYLFDDFFKLMKEFKKGAM